MHLLAVLLLFMQGVILTSESGSVTGTLTNAAGKPEAGVRVTAIPAGNPATPNAAEAAAMVSLTETDSKGRYLLESIPPGRYYISAGRVDFPTYYPGTLDVAAAITVEVRARQKVEGIDVRLQSNSAGRSLIVAGLIARPASGFQIPLQIRIDGGGKVPVVVGSQYPYLRVVSPSGGRDYLFNEVTISLPLPSPSTPDQYRVEVHDVPAGYSVKSMTYRTGATVRDLTRDPLPVSLQNASVMPIPNLVSVFPNSSSLATSSSPLELVLTPPPASPIPGRRVTGTQTGPPGEMYLSGIAGTVYVDDSFEFVGVPPGLHTVTKFSGTTANPQGALVVVGDQDVSDVKLRVYDLIPADIERDAPRAAGNLPPGPLAFFSLNGRVVDADSGMPITDGGAIRLWGYRNSSKAFALDGVGEFRVRELLPGSYRIEIQLAGYQPYTASVSIDQVAADATFPVQRSSGR